MGRWFSALELTEIDPIGILALDKIAGNTPLILWCSSMTEYVKLFLIRAPGMIKIILVLVLVQGCSPLPNMKLKKCWDCECIIIYESKECDLINGQMGEKKGYCAYARMTCPFPAGSLIGGLRYV